MRLSFTGPVLVCLGALLVAAVHGQQQHPSLRRAQGLSAPYSYTDPNAVYGQGDVSANSMTGGGGFDLTVPSQQGAAVAQSNAPNNGAGYRPAEIQQPATTPPPPQQAYTAPGTNVMTPPAAPVYGSLQTNTVVPAAPSAPASGVTGGATGYGYGGAQPSVPMTVSGQDNVTGAVVETRPGVQAPSSYGGYGSNSATAGSELPPASPSTPPGQDDLGGETETPTVAPSLAPSMDTGGIETTFTPTVATDDLYSKNEPANNSPPWNNPDNIEPATKPKTETYKPPSDDTDPVAGKNDDEIVDAWTEKTPYEIAKEEADKVLKDKYVPIVAGVCGGIALLLMICVAQQMIENPDGCLAKMCRCSVACFRILCWPCRAICCCGGSRAKARRTHDLIHDPTSHYGYNHDLELT